MVCGSEKIIEDGSRNQLIGPQPCQRMKVSISETAILADLTTTSSMSSYVTHAAFGNCPFEHV